MKLQSASRINWIDSVKAIGIFLMVLCHAKLSNATLTTIIYSFHMPLFFLLSGYFEKGKEISLGGVKKYLQALIIPYFFFSICSFSICWISPYIHPEIYHMDSFGKIFKSACIGMLLMEDRVTSFSFMPSGPLWFLIALFHIKVLFATGIWIYNKKRMMIIPYIFLLFVIYKCNILYFSVDSALLAFPFYCVGFFFREFHQLDLFNYKRIYVAVIGIVLFVYLIVAGVQNGRVDIDGGLYGSNILLFYLNGIIGTVMCIMFAKAVKQDCKYVSICGQSTITILGTHLLFLKPLLVFMSLVLHFSTSNMPFLSSVAMTIIACIGGAILHSLLSTCCPFLIGKKGYETKGIDNFHTHL